MPASLRGGPSQNKAQTSQVCDNSVTQSYAGAPTTAAARPFLIALLCCDARGAGSPGPAYCAPGTPAPPDSAPGESIAALAAGTVNV
jgi:hypothetical protein